MKKIALTFLMLGLMVAGGCSSAPERQVKKGELASEINSKQSKKFYETVGFGAPSENATTKASKKQTSYEAAKASALNDIAGYIYGVKLESGMTIQDAIAKDSTINTEVAAFIRGAEIVKREWDVEDGCAVTMRINPNEFKNHLKNLGVE